MEEIYEDEKVEKEFLVSLEETSIKILSKYIVISSMLTKGGKLEMLDGIDELSLMKKDKKKLPKVGSFERIMNLFGGRK